MMTKVMVGDTLESRHSRRKGKQVKVTAVDDKRVYFEVTRDHDDAQVSTVGSVSSVKLKNLNKDYKKITVDPEPVLMPNPEEIFGSVNLNLFIPDEVLANSVQESEDEELTPEDEASLHEALNTVGYYKMPDETAMVSDISEALQSIQDDEGVTVSLEDITSTVVQYIKSFN